jgi:hypothetical protein
VSEPFPVTAFNSPRLMVAKLIPAVSISLTQDRLVVTVTQASGNIWVLDNVDRLKGAMARHDRALVP